MHLSSPPSCSLFLVWCSILTSPAFFEQQSVATATRRISSMVPNPQRLGIRSWSANPQAFPVVFAAWHGPVCIPPGPSPACWRRRAAHRGPGRGGVGVATAHPTPCPWGMGWGLCRGEGCRPPDLGGSGGPVRPWPSAVPHALLEAAGRPRGVLRAAPRHRRCPDGAHSAARPAPFFPPFPVNLSCTPGGDAQRSFLLFDAFFWHVKFSKMPILCKFSVLFHRTFGVFGAWIFLICFAFLAIFVFPHFFIIFHFLNL